MESLNNKQIGRLLDVARRHSARDALMVLLALQHGLRASEVCGLKVSHFDPGQDGVFLRIQRLKGSLYSVQQLMAETARLLIEHIEGRGPDDFVFPGRTKGTHIHRATFYLKFCEYCELAGIPKHQRFPHILKHTCAMTMIHSSDLAITQKYLGHKSIRSTAQYLKPTDQTASAAAHKAFAAMEGSA